MRTRSLLVLLSAAAAAAAGCAHPMAAGGGGPGPVEPREGAAEALLRTEDVRCGAVAAALRAWGPRGGGALPRQAALALSDAEPVQVYLREGDVLERLFEEPSGCDVGPGYRLVQDADYESLTLVFTRAPGGTLAWEARRGVGLAVSDEPRPMGALSLRGGVWVEAGGVAETGSAL
jgi:hypothetical protein